MMSEVEIRDYARFIMAGNRVNNADYMWCVGMIAGFAHVLGYDDTDKFVASLKVA